MSLPKFLCACLLFTVGLRNISAQNIQLGITMDEQQSALAAGDATFTDGRYYKNLTFTLKAGESALFYMLANEFSPQIYIVDTTLTNWLNGVPKSIGSFSGSFIWMNATSDYTFHVVYSSNYAGSTGNFSFGIRKMAAGQNDLSKATTTCDRLYYLLNNWFACFGLIDGTMASNMAFFPVPSVYFPGSQATVNSATDYIESLYYGNQVATAEKYDATVAEITNCIDLNVWDITKDFYMDELITGASFTTTYFTLKGSMAETPLSSFSVTWIEDPTGENEIELELY